MVLGEAPRGGGARRTLLAPEQAVHQRCGAGARVPSQSQHGDLHRLAAEGQGLVTAPHVEVQQPAFHGGAGVHHGVDAVELHVAGGQADHRSGWQELRVGGGDAAPHRYAGRSRRALAVGGGGESKLGAGLRLAPRTICCRAQSVSGAGHEGHCRAAATRAAVATRRLLASSLGSISGINCRSAEVLISLWQRAHGCSHAEPAGPYPP